MSARIARREPRGETPAGSFVNNLVQHLTLPSRKRGWRGLRAFIWRMLHSLHVRQHGRTERPCTANQTSSTRMKRTVVRFAAAEGIVCSLLRVCPLRTAWVTPSPFLAERLHQRFVSRETGAGGCVQSSRFPPDDLLRCARRVSHAARTSTAMLSP